MNCNVRVLNITAKNLKNLKFGSIDFNSKKQVLNGDFEFRESDIIGIYGQNGSSKSTIINAFTIIKKLFSKTKHSTDLLNYIAKDSSECEVEITLFVGKEKYKYIIEYNVVIETDIERTKVAIKSEIINYKKFDDQNLEWSKKTTLFNINNNNLNNFISPKTNVEKLINGNKNIYSELLVLKGIKSNDCFSFLISNEFQNILKYNNTFIEIAECIEGIMVHSLHCMHLYDNREISKITALDTIPFFYKTEKANTINTTKGSISLFNESLLSVEYEDIVKKFIEEINIVLDKLLPGIVVGVVNLGETLDKEGNRFFRCQFVSKKQDFDIPLRLESDGVKKIISILSSLVDAFVNPYAILIVDELDSGIFEFLLGVILDVFKTRGVGQLLFTSHNLRALEVIKDDIIFTTNNPRERFVKMPYVQKTNNLRKKYLKDLYLGETETLSIGIDSYEIYRAMKKAGDLCLDGQK